MQYAVCYKRDCYSVHIGYSSTILTLWGFRRSRTARFATAPICLNVETNRRKIDAHTQAHTHAFKEKKRKETGEREHPREYTEIWEKKMQKKKKSLKEILSNSLFSPEQSQSSRHYEVDLQVVSNSIHMQDKISALYISFFLVIETKTESWNGQI